MDYLLQFPSQRASDVNQIFENDIIASPVAILVRMHILTFSSITFPEFRL